MKNARTMVVALLATSFVAAGCGSSNKSSSSSTSTPSTASTAAATTSTPSTTSTASTATTSSVPKTADAAVQAGIASCKQSISAQPTISADVKTKLLKVCDKITDAAGAKAAIQDVCTTILNQSNIPAGAAKDQALAACKAG